MAGTRGRRARASHLLTQLRSSEARSLCKSPFVLRPVRLLRSAVVISRCVNSSQTKERRREGADARIALSARSQARVSVVVGKC